MLKSTYEKSSQIKKKTTNFVSLTTPSLRETSSSQQVSSCLEYIKSWCRNESVTWTAIGPTYTVGYAVTAQAAAITVTVTDGSQFTTAIFTMIYWSLNWLHKLYRWHTWFKKYASWIPENLTISMKKPMSKSNLCFTTMSRKSNAFDGRNPMSAWNPK